MKYIYTTQDLITSRGHGHFKEIPTHFKGTKRLSKGKNVRKSLQHNLE
uniref:Uncharacterized protein n=1 Tax=Rhizophora mucronata TaxID=61149 RepID=A0A2P2MN28_RHIMU